MLEEPSRVMQRVFKAEGLADGTRELEHLLVDVQRLVRKTKMPHGERQITAVRDPSILTHQCGPESRPLAIVELSQGPRTTITRPGKIPAIESGQAFQKESLHHDAGVVEPFGKSHRFVRKFGADPEIATHDMEGKIPPHRGENLRRLPNPLGQYS